MVGLWLVIYLVGSCEVIVMGFVVWVDLWNVEYCWIYLLLFDGVFVVVLVMEDLCLFLVLVLVKECLQCLLFISVGLKKWGVVFMGGICVVNVEDFVVLIGLLLLDGLVV